jgi:hypothetical protein
MPNKGDLRKIVVRLVQIARSHSLPLKEEAEWLKLTSVLREVRERSARQAGEGKEAEGEGISGADYIAAHYGVALSVTEAMFAKGKKE